MRSRRTAITATVAASLIATAAFAQHKATFESLWNDATSGQYVLTEFDYYTRVQSGAAFYYFTKPGHEAHPGVVRRALAKNNQQYFIDTQGWSFAKEAGQPGFKKWLAEFDLLNRDDGSAAATATTIAAARRLKDARLRPNYPGQRIAARATPIRLLGPPHNPGRHRRCLG